MNKEIKKNKLNNLTLIIVVLFLGFFAGITGEIFTKYYLSNLTFFRDLYFIDQNGTGQREIIIRDPKKVVVEQDLRVEQIKNEIQPAVVSLYQNKQSKPTLLDKVFLPSDFLGQAVVLTSDGWLISSSGAVVSDHDNLTVVGYNKDIYKVEKIIKDNLTDIVFLKIDAQNLPVVKFTDFSNVINSQQVLVYNSYLQQIDLTNIQNKSYEELVNKYDFITSTGSLSKNILLNQQFSADYYQGAAVFDMQGEVIGLIFGDNKILTQAVPVHYIDPIISQVLKEEEIKRPNLGINYLNISQIQGLTEDERRGIDNTC